MSKAPKYPEQDYILTYYQRIQDGTETAGRWIRDWYALVVNGLQEKRWFFDRKKSAKARNEESLSPSVSLSIE